MHDTVSPSLRIVLVSTLVAVSSCRQVDATAAEADSGLADAPTVPDAPSIDAPDATASEASVDALEPGAPIVGGNHWRPVGGPTRPGTITRVHVLGDDVYIESGNTLYVSTSAGWTRVRTFKYAGGVTTRTGTGKALVHLGVHSIHRYDGASWTSSACPASNCSGGIVLETSSGATLFANSKDGSILRRASGATTWTFVTASGCVPNDRYSANGNRVVIGDCYSIDDGMTFANATTDGPGSVVASMVGTPAGILASFNGSNTYLRGADGVWKNVLPATTINSPRLAADGATVLATSLDSWQLVRSKDGGATWTVTLFPDPPPIAGVSTTRIVTMWDPISVSSDDGATFTALASCPVAHAAVNFAYRATAIPELWTFADRYSPQRSKDDGVTWTGYPSGTWEIDWPDGPKTGGQFFLFATPTTHKLYVGSHNGLGTFDDAANAFVESPSHPDSKLFGGPIYGGGGRLLAVSVGRFSFDDGVTWTAPAPFGSDFGFSFTSGGIDATGTAWALHAAHETTTLYKSTDGTTWTPKPGVDPRPFSVARDGMFFSGDGEILRSSDEGTTWTKLLSLSIGSWFLLPAGPASTLVVSDEDGAEGFVVRVSKDGGATFSDWTYDLPQAPSAFYLGNDHLWATVPDLGLFELVKK